jgi:hypothetical protein
VNIGFLMVIKRIDKERINEISNELLLYKLLKEGHPSIIAFYQSVQNENKEYLFLQEYYDDTLALLNQSLTE